jgi:dihydroorotate dehydrogenase
MPDWFYRTVSRTVLFQFPAVTARDFALGVMGRLVRLPFGPAVIDFLGHMRADPRLRRSLLGINFPTPIGLGPHLDAAAVALPALARFGVGFFEVGPVTLAGSVVNRPIERRPDDSALWLPDPPTSLSLTAVKPRLIEASRLGLPLIVRLGGVAAAECAAVIRALAPYAHLFSLDAIRAAVAAGRGAEEWAAHVRSAVDAARSASPPRPVLLCVPADVDSAKADPFIGAAIAAGVAGLLIDGSVRAAPDGRLVGSPAREAALSVVRRLRGRNGAGVPIIASGGVHEPADALALRAAGADLVQVDTGLVYSGPGLPKRINDAILYEITRGAPPPEQSERPPEMTWCWTALMGAGMLIGSLMALVIAATRVVLPYDESFVGLSRDQLAAINPRLLAFMTHDRVSLAGTMVAIGVVYVGLSLFGIRRGLHWARQAAFASAFTGFASFFLFLGFGYLDPFHAFVTASLLQLLLLGVHSRLGTYTPAVAPSVRNDPAWRRSLWGQLLLVIHGFALLGAGATIWVIGVTQVFVHEDLQFMRTTAEALRSAHPRLVPLVAHDRATFGGMLLAAGWAFLLPALWGFRTGSAWLWWTLLVGGLSAYAAAIGVHFAVGYVDAMHLAPAFAGLGVFSMGLGLSYSYLSRET